MNIKEIEIAYLPFVKASRDRLINQLSLKTLEDIAKHKVEIEKYINHYLQLLLRRTHKIVSAQILSELEFALIPPNYKPID